MLENIRTHGSLKPQYEIMITQSVVLLVSHFATAVRSVLRTGLEEALQAGRSEAAQKFEVRARAGDLQGAGSAAS